MSTTATDPIPLRGVDDDTVVLEPEVLDDDTLPEAMPTEVERAFDEEHHDLEGERSYQLVPVQTKVRRRLEASENRLRTAMRRLRLAGRSVTPAAQIRANPMAFLAGSLAVGFLLGALTARRSD